MDHKFIASKTFFNQVKKVVYLVKNVWKEGTTALIHAPRTTDKSAAALSIASDVADSSRKVLYINAEEHLDAKHEGKDNLFIFTPEFESIDDKTDYADLVFDAIEHAVRTTEIRTFVIDSISRIAALSFGRNASVAYIMKRIVALQVKCKLSILVVADDATKTVNNAVRALAAGEIPFDDEKTDPIAAVPSTDRSAQTETKKATVVGIKTTVTDVAESLSLTDLTRRQRRALERRAAKGKFKGSL